MRDENDAAAIVEKLNTRANCNSKKPKKNTSQD